MGKKHSTVSGLSRFLSIIAEPSPPHPAYDSASLNTELVTSTALAAVADSSLALKTGSTSSTALAVSATNTPDNDESAKFAGLTKGAKRIFAVTLKNAESSRPTKKRKVGLLGPGHERYDATGIVPQYTHASQVPEHLQKYFAQRDRFFSLYAQGCLLDEVGWYSVTPERVADQIAERCRCDTVLDAFCGVGGNAIAFARTCQRVIALDTSPTRLALARHNAAVYGVAEHIEFVLADFVSFARAHAARPRAGRTIDVVFLSPPWGGPAYLDGATADATAKGKEKARSAEDQDEHPVFGLSSVQPLHGKDLFDLARTITRNVAYYLPRNTDLAEVAALVGGGAQGADTESGVVAGPVTPENVEVEEEWMGSKLKALTCYFGGLVAGQEDAFDAI